MASRSLPNSIFSSLKRRKSMITARGESEVAIYERFSSVSYSDEDEDMNSPFDDDDSPDEDIDGDREEPSLDMELGDETSNDSRAAPAPTTIDRKGKGKAVDSDSEVHPPTAMSLKRKRIPKKRGYSCSDKSDRSSARQKNIIILLRKDSGWSFSQDAFFPSYLRDQYYLASTSTSPNSSFGSYTPSLAEREFIDDEEDLQPQVTDIILPPLTKPQTQ